MLRRLLEFLIRPLVEDMANVQIECTETPTMTLFCLWARKGDLGRILGKKGQTIEDIRRVMETAAAREDREVIIDVLEQPKQKSNRKKRSSSST